MQQPSPDQQLNQMITGYWVSQAIYVAAKLNLADRIAEGPKSADELAALTDTHARSLYRLLRALAGVGIFAETDDGRFTMTPLAERLQSDVEGSKHAMAVMMGEEHFYTWAQLLYSVQTGQGAFRKVYGQGVFEFLGDNPQQAKIFDAAMTAIHGSETGPMLEAYDFSGINTLCDIGGGNGSLLLEALRRNPHMQGLLFDLPGVIDRANHHIAAAGMSDRCRAESGDFFQAVPSGADAYLMRHIIHDWDDEKATTILRNCCNRLDPGGRVLVVEFVVPPGNGPSFSKLLDLTMLLIPEGAERTVEEYRALFAAAGLRLSRVVNTAAEVSVIEAVKA